MNNQQTGYLKPLQILFGAMLIGQTLATVILYLFVPVSKPEEGDNNLTDIFPLIMVTMVVSGYVLFNMRRKTWVAETDLDAKKSLYRSASILKWGLFEGATMLALIGYFFLGIDMLLLPLVALLVHFAVHFPSRERVSKALETDNID